MLVLFDLRDRDDLSTRDKIHCILTWSAFCEPPFSTSCSDHADATTSRALDNIGRSYCVLGDFQMATD